MKNKQTIKKLHLNKMGISNLSKFDESLIKGGASNATTCKCIPGTDKHICATITHPPRP
jgi:hypothetical protein